MFAQFEYPRILLLNNYKYNILNVYRDTAYDKQIFFGCDGSVFMPLFINFAYILMGLLWTGRKK